MSQMMDAKDLARWTRFANKGGIGKCTALADCVAQGSDDLMFLADDEITVLMQLSEENVFLGYCEGVVGRFNGKDVRFHSKLKKPIIQKRSSTSTASLKSISPIHSPSLPRDEDLHDLGDASSGRLSLPPLPKSSRTYTITDEIQEKLAANRPKSSISNRSSSRPSTPPKTTATNKRRGLINDNIDSAPVPAPSPIHSEDHSIYSLNEYPFPKPPTTLPNPSIARTASIKQRGEPIEIAPAPSPRPVSAVSHNDSFRDSTFSTTLNDSVLSVALEDDVETGIGLRLLAGLSGDEDDEDEEEETDKTAILSGLLNNNAPPDHLRQPSASSPMTQMFESPQISPRSAYDDSMDSEWDVGADIYDNYRYSRYSMSAKSSRSGTPRGGPLGNYFTDKPRERKESNTSSKFDRRRSTATVTTIASAYSEPDRSIRRGENINPESDTLVFPLPPTTEPLNFVKKSARPSPLDLANQRHISSTEPTPPLTTPSPSTPSSRHISGGTNQSRSPLLHTTFASPTASIYSSQTASLHIPFNEGDSEIRSSVASDITERIGFETVEAALDKVTSGALSKAGVKVKQQSVAGRNESGDTVVESMDDASHQDEEVIVFNGADISRRSNGIVTTSPSTTDADITLITDSSLSIMALTDPYDRTGSPTAFGDVSTLEPPPSLAYDHASPPSPTPAFPPSPSTILTHTPPIDPAAARRSVGPSIFPPHPFAPKAPPTSTASTLSRGPSIHRTGGPSQGPGTSLQPQAPRQAISPSLSQTLREAALSYSNPPPNMPPQLRRAATIHGRTEKDLSSASGPVLMAWTVDTWREREFDKRKEDPPKKTSSKSDTRMTIMMPTLVKRGSKASLRQNVPIPRANFNPNAGSPRPRSRSFSEFGESNPFGGLPKRTGSPSSPLGSPKFPPARSASPLSRPAMTGSPSSPVASSGKQPQMAPRTQASPLAPTLDASARIAASRTSSPAAPTQGSFVQPVQPPPRTVTLDGSRAGLGIGSGTHAGLANTQSPSAALAALSRNFAPHPMQDTIRSASPTTAAAMLGEGTNDGSRVLTRSPSPIGAAPGPSSFSQTTRSIPVSAVERISSRMTSRSRPSTDSQNPPEAQLLPSRDPNSESLLPPVRRATSPSSDSAARSAASSPGVPSPQAPNPSSPNPMFTQSSLRKVQSTASLRSLGSRSSQAAAFKANFEHPFPFGEENKAPPPVQPPSRRSSRFRSASRASSDRRPSLETNQSNDHGDSIGHQSQQRTASMLDHELGNSPPTSPIRAASIRSRRSFSQLRSRSIKLVREVASPTQVEFEEETIQVKDMEFELVKPIIRHREHRDSDESTAESKEALSPRVDLRADADSIRSHSPALLAVRSPDAQSPAASSVDSFPHMQARKAQLQAQSQLQSAASAIANDVNHEAHRARELKWISSMSSIPSAQARKNKKIRKLLQDPVPDSVRYLVWAHVLDAKAKRIPNVYSQIANRPKGPVSEQIEKDAYRCFTQQPHLQDPKGPVISVVNAYLAMVPDIRYHPGLTVIAGHLLLQSPEEDAFWIFLALMETHLRPYYSLSGSQLEADAYLFTKVLESVDSQLAHVLFVDLRVRPIDVCRAWFPSIFSGVLPNAHLHRVWDILFYEGPILLFRVGATIIQLSRRMIIQSLQSTQSVLPLLISPDPELLPHAEIFLNHVLSLKLNDGDLRKQRIKVEASMRPPQRTPTISRLRK